MAEWTTYYQNEDEVEGEEGEEGEADVRYSGRDSLIFLVDASQSMFERGEDDEMSPFDMTLQCIRSVYTSKIISSDRDLLALVFFGTAEHKNSVPFKHVYVYHDLDTPGARRVLDLHSFQGEKGQTLFQETLGCSADFSLQEALWVCSNLFSDVKTRLSHKRVMLFTNQDNPHAEDSGKARLARSKASDLRDTGVVLDLMNLPKPGGFDVSLFYRDIITVDEDEGDLGLQQGASEKLEDLQRRVRAREMKKRAQARLSLTLGDGVSLAVGVYVLVRSATKPYPVRLYRESNEQVKTKTRWFHAETGSLLLPSDTKKAQTYGSKQIVLEKEETEEVKKFDEPGLVLIGFKPLERLERHHHLRPAHFIYPEESQVTGSSKLFTALLMRCLERKVFALCRYTPRRNTPPRFAALVAQSEELDKNRVQLSPPGFHVIFLPYADDIRSLDYPEKTSAKPEQIDKMKEIVHKLRFKYQSEAFENPVIQQHYRNLEALALDLLEPEQIEDLTLPKAEMMDRRLGSLVSQFKELVYPPGYNPEGKGAQVKRKSAGDSGGGGAEKKPCAEVPEEELRAHVKNGTLGKLTVPLLKEACKQLGMRVTGTKKQELIDTLTAHFNR
ncbi:X-ray repair cross-complementing protein 5 isoform X1 [Acipenser ruthenus]|uniref:X-ray repair cross-complementing protein 5 isoform X1 n=1 Tax=Acipenser ruthenus TaxID=7906 RepID=UPI002740D874|nr:X-ray repair cross-complementing protein 5 isoform X1 [Acipenser ruthenus]